MFNEHGENFKARFQVCKMMYDMSSCTNSGSCSDIHTTLKDFSGVLGQETHVCDEETLSLYRRLPDDVTVRVYQQNSTDDFNEFSGDKVLLTLGAQQYLDAFMNEGRRIPRKKMQHCAHFRLKRLCRMGPGCKFIHVILEGQGGSTNPLDDDMDTYGLASQSSHPRMESPRSGTDSPIMTEVNVIVRERSRGAGYRSPLSVNSVGSRTTSPQLPPSQPKPKSAMGPGDVAAMLAMRINNNSQVLTAGSPLIPPSIDGIVAPARSPTRINNPYHQPVSGSSSANSSFSEAKASGNNRPSSGGAQPYVTSNPSASSPYAPNYSNATVHAVPAPPNTADQGYGGYPTSPPQPYAAQQHQEPQQYQPYPQQQQLQQQPQQRYSAFPQQQQHQQYVGYPAEYQNSNTAQPQQQHAYPPQQPQQQQQYYQGIPQQQQQGYTQQQPNYPSQQQQQQQPHQQPSSYQPYSTQQQQHQVYSASVGGNAQYAYPPSQQPQPPPPQQQQYYQQQQVYPQQPHNGQNWS
jgi:hypothetical protein